MCPLRFILVFFSAILAGYFAWRTVCSSPDGTDMTISQLDSTNNENAIGSSKQEEDAFNFKTVCLFPSSKFHFGAMQPLDGLDSSFTGPNNPNQSTPSNARSIEEFSVYFLLHFVLYYSIQMFQNGFWVFVDMASGKYLWRNFKEMNQVKVKC